MQCNGAHVPLVHMLVHLEHIPLMIERGIDGLMERRQITTSQINHRSVNLLNHPKGQDVSVYELCSVDVGFSSVFRHP